MDIPFRTDLIPQTAVKYDTVPYTYRFQASVVKDVFFEFFQVLFLPLAVSAHQIPDPSEVPGLVCCSY